jgi:hypothetical protein
VTGPVRSYFIVRDGFDRRRHRRLWGEAVGVDVTGSQRRWAAASESVDATVVHMSIAI